MMADFVRKKAAVFRAEDEITRALKTVADVFKNFREDYLALLLDYEQNLEIVERYRKNEQKSIFLASKNKLSESGNISKIPERIDLESEGKTGRKDDSYSTQNSEIPETLGIVENTQLPKQINTVGKVSRNNINNTRKSIFSSRLNANNENKIPSSAFDTSLNSQSKTQNSGRLCLSKVHSDIQISTKGKVSRQTKLVLQPVNVKTDVSIHEGNSKNSVPTVSKDYNDPADLDIDITFFDSPFSMEQESYHDESKLDETIKQSTEDVIESSPVIDSMKKRGRLKLKKKSPLKNSTENEHNTAMSSEVFLGEFDQWSTQESISPSGSTNPIVQIERKNPSPLKGSGNSAGISLENNLSEKSQVLVDDSHIFKNCKMKQAQKHSIEQEKLKKSEEFQAYEVLLKDPKTLSQNSSSIGDMDETYFSPVEGILAERNLEVSNKETSSIPKRKFEDVSGPSKKKKDKSVPAGIPGCSNIETDWNTDSLLEKSESSPPHKKLLMDSFDVFPEKKKKSPDFAYKGPVVRKKSERAKLRGWDCQDCEKWYENMDLTEKELEMRKNQCSRHRSKYNERYFTPPGFWNPMFSSDESSSED